VEYENDVPYPVRDIQSHALLDNKLINGTMKRMAVKPPAEDCRFPGTREREREIAIAVDIGRGSVPSRGYDNSTFLLLHGKFGFLVDRRHVLLETFLDGVTT
jgi:hypothetical protein